MFRGLGYFRVWRFTGFRVVFKGFRDLGWLEVLGGLSFRDLRQLWTLGF